MRMIELSKLDFVNKVSRKKLKIAFKRAHNRNSIQPEYRKKTHLKFGTELSANNYYARYEVSRSILLALCKHLKCGDGSESDQTAFHLTIVFQDGFQALDARKIELGSIKRHLVKDLAGLNYIGQIEPGLYVGLPRENRFSRTQIISWHAHIILWEMDHTTAGHLVRRLKESGHYEAIHKPLQPILLQQINNGDLARTFGYAFKPPTKSYRLSSYDCQADGTPNLNDWGKPQAIGKKRRSTLRPGERITLFKAFKDFTLRDLVVAGGSGARIRTDAIRQGCSRLRRAVKTSVRSKQLSR